MLVVLFNSKEKDIEFDREAELLSLIWEEIMKIVAEHNWLVMNCTKWMTMLKCLNICCLTWTEKNECAELFKLNRLDCDIWTD